MKNGLKYAVTSENYNKLCTTGVIIELPNISTIKVTGVYRCHYFEIDAFINDLEELVNINSTFENHVIIGDTNLDLMDLKIM